MANEVVKVELYGPNNDGNPRRYAIVDGASVSKGALLALINGRTVSTAQILNMPFAIAKEEHLSGDGTSISCFTDGIFTGYASGAVATGNRVAASLPTSPNYFRAAVSLADMSSSYAGIGSLCYALTDAVDGATFQFRYLI